jgi:hypothetical protein
MTSTLTHVAAVVTGLAIVVSGFPGLLTVTRRGLFPGLAAGLVLGVVSALLIRAVRSFG